MCITNIRQRNLSTNKGYRATFTKAQVGEDSGTEAGQYGSFYRFPYTHNALTAKNAFIWSVHTLGGGTAAHQRRVANVFFCCCCFSFHFGAFQAVCPV